MRTIALRFGEMFSPECGTIKAHQQIIDEKGYVWYGKLGSEVSSHVLEEMKQNHDPRFLLIKSGKTNRYWVHFSDVSKERPGEGEYPSYYGEMAYAMKTWFKVLSIDIAPKNILSLCCVVSSGKLLSEASKKSMSPYFIIDYIGEE